MAVSLLLMVYTRSRDSKNEIHAAGYWPMVTLTVPVRSIWPSSQRVSNT